VHSLQELLCMFCRSCCGGGALLGVLCDRLSWWGDYDLVARCCAIVAVTLLYCGLQAGAAVAGSPGHLRCAMPCVQPAQESADSQSCATCNEGMTRVMQVHQAY
jgi:hypothetical protein